MRHNSKHSNSNHGHMAQVKDIFGIQQFYSSVVSILPITDYMGYFLHSACKFEISFNELHKARCFSLK